ncbi:MAG: ABC transporter substrate-binding protein [Candidatus Rokubacteria bacterium]|nr:ABC transporter substrate-binding protein [Candidatus Rokubacteria bacterium]
MRTLGVRVALLGVMAVVFSAVLTGEVAVASGAPQGEIGVAMAVLDQRFNPVEMVALTNVMNFNFLFDGLFNLGPDDKYPALATGYKVSNDGLAIEFALRRGVTFHNGDPFTAEDVKFTFEQLLSPDSTHAYRKGFQEALARVEVLNPYSVRFHLKKPWGAFFTTARYGLQAIVPKKYYQQVGAKGFQQKPVGTGPFMLADLKAGEWTKFEANPRYWGQVSEVRFVTQRLVAEGMARYAMLARGEADVISGLTGPLLKEVRRNATLRITQTPYAGTTFLTFNRRSNPELKDRRVRLAVAHAIDRDGIAQAILSGTCQVASQPFTPATFGYESSIKPIPYDPARAKALLTEAGIKDGHPINFVMHTGSFQSLPNTPQVLEAIAGNLEAVGFRVNRQPLETGALLSAWRSHTLEGISYAPSTAPDDGGALMDSWLVSWGTFSNEIKEPAYDEAFKRQLTEINLEKRRAILQQWAKLEAERLETVPLFWCGALFAVGPRVKEWRPGLGSGYHLNLHLLRLAK